MSSSRVKVKLLLSKQGEGTELYNDCSTSYTELNDKIQQKARKLAGSSSGYVLSYEAEGRRVPLTSQSDFEELALRYEAGVRATPLGAATFRVRVHVSWPGPALEGTTPVQARAQSQTRHHAQAAPCTSAACSHEQPLKKLRKENQAPRCSPSAEGSRRARRNPSAPASHKQQHGTHHVLPQQPQPSTATAALSGHIVSGSTTSQDWDSAVLSSIQRTVTAHSLAARLAQSPAAHHHVRSSRELGLGVGGSSHGGGGSSGASEAGAARGA